MVQPVLDELGEIDGCPIIAVTDSAGPNVIIGGGNYPKHYLSPTYKDHAIAVEVGKRIVSLQTIPTTFTNMKCDIEATERSYDVLLDMCYRVSMERYG